LARRQLSVLQQNGSSRDLQGGNINIGCQVVVRSCQLSEYGKEGDTLLQFTRWMQSRIASLRSGAERGAAAVEYGLLVALIAVAIIFAVMTLGSKVKGTFNCVASDLPQGSTQITGSPAC
jgi:pilus assembly protein Flp/PilA